MSDENPAIMTVTGPVARTGKTLPHEHTFSDLSGADVPVDYDPDAVEATVVPVLRGVKGAGYETLVDCTGAYFGRDVALLRRLSEGSGLNILTNTGYYGASAGKFLPSHAHTEPAERLAERWIAEWRDGIDGTGIRPGFIKIAVNPGPLSAIDRKLVQAACITHRGTGLTIACHTGDARAAADELRELAVQGVHPSAWIWVHAQHATVDDQLFEAAEAGTWIELDGLGAGEKAVPRHLELVLAMREAGFLHRVLLSHDGDTYQLEKPNGGTPRGYSTLHEHLIPALLDHGVTEAEVKQLTVGNPNEAFTIRKRLRA